MTCERPSSAAGLQVVVEIERESSDLQVTAEVLARWFTASTAPGPSRPSYADHLRSRLSQDELAKVYDLFRGQLLNRPVAWQASTAFVLARS